MNPNRLLLVFCLLAVAADAHAAEPASKGSTASKDSPAFKDSPASKGSTASKDSATSMVQEILVDDFEVGMTHGLFAQRKNRLDGFQGTWARRPSYTVITKVEDTRPGRQGNSLRIEYSKTGGWCGWYTLLNGIDVTDFNALTFWVKGEKGGERFDVGLADERMQDLEIDAVYAGPIMAFLPQGVTTDWQQVKVPLAPLRSDLDLSRMGSLVIWFRYEGKGAIQVDDIIFVFDPEVQRIAQENVPRATPDPRAPRFTWVWKYDPVSNRQVRQELLDFCRKTAITTLFLYLGEDPIPKMPKGVQENLAEFLRQADAQGIRVEALQGNPLWALKDYHPLVLEWVDGFLEFNRHRPLPERIRGVSLDIEPYLTSEWETGDREKLKEEFIELLTLLRNRIDEQKRESEFLLGIAIPVFYDREPGFEEALLAQADYAALMDYYDMAVDIVKNGQFHIDLANRLGKRMVIGVETQDLVQMGQGKRRNTFHEEGWEEMERQLSQVVDDFTDQPSFAGIAIHAYDTYRLLQRGRNVPTRERTGKVPVLTATRGDRPVTVDGDLTDWASANWFNVHQRSQALYGAGAWKGSQDLSYRFAFGWEPQLLLLAMDVTDDSLVQRWRGADMWEGDHVELWIDSDLYGDYTEAVNSSDDFQFGLSPGDFGELPPEVHVWVPSVDPASLKEIQIASQKTATGYTLEVRLPTSVLFRTLGKRVGVEPGIGPIPRRIAPEIESTNNGVLASGKLVPGFTLGVMVDGSDTDEARLPQKCLLSCSPERQWGDPTTFNVLELR